MTITNSEVRREYTGNASTTTFPFYGTVYATSDIVVHVAGSLQTQGVHYDVTGTLPGSVSVVFKAAYIPALGASVIIESNIPETQATDLPAAGRYAEANVEQMADKATRLIHQIKGRSVLLPLGSPVAGPLQLPQLQASKFIRVNAAGTALELVTASEADLVGILDDTIPSCTFAALPPAGTAGKMRRLTDGDRGVWMDNGTTWIPLGMYINARWFGVVGDGVTDDYAALQAAINYTVAVSGVLYIPVGVYSISQPLIISTWDGTQYNGYASCTIIGGGMPFYSTTFVPQATRIVPTFKDRFALGIQKGRGCRISDILLVGQNDFLADLTPFDYPEMASSAVFNSKGCRDSRYSPYAGIAVDPFGSSLPGDGGYPDMSAWYDASNAGSSDNVFERVYVHGFICGILLSANGTLTNAENNTFHHCYSQFNKVGFAIGHTQVRNTQWFGGSNAFNEFGFDGRHYGDQVSGAPCIHGCDMAGRFLFNVNTDRGFPTVVQGVHAESFSSLGFLAAGIHGGQGNDPFTFLGCLFDFNPLGGNIADYHLIANCPVHFVGCSLENSSYLSHKFPLRMMLNRTQGSISFSSSSIGVGFDIHDEMGVAFAVTGAGAAMLPSVFFNNARYADNSTRGGGAQVLSHHKISLAPNWDNKQIAPIGARVQSTYFADRLFFVGGSELQIDLGTLAVVNATGGIGTFTVSDASVVRAGDLICTSTAIMVNDGIGGTTFQSDWTCLGVVSEVDGTDVTIVGVPKDLASGSYHLYVAGWPRWHDATTGDTHSNTTIDNVSNPTAWAVGNRIKGSGIPDGAYITDITGTTFTISKAATATAAGIRLYDADVRYVAGTAF